MIRKIICVLLLVYAGGGLLCACQDQTPEPLPKSKTVRKKISIPVPGKKENLTIADASTADNPPENTEPAPENGKADKEENTQDVKDVKKDKAEDPVAKTDTPVADKKTEPGAEKNEAPDSDATAEDIAADSEPGEAGDGITEAIAGIDAQEDDDGQSILAAYNPKGRTDPFEPLFKQKMKKDKAPEPEPRDTASKPKTPPRRLTPLEKLDLDQLKLVGIIRAESGNKALVEEASGKGYIIVKGTYVGIRSGIVVDILQDRVVVEEKDEDVLGKVTVRKRELKFNRPEGDDYYEM